MAKFRVTYTEGRDQVIEAEGVARTDDDYRFWDNTRATEAGGNTVALIPADRVKTVLKIED